MNEPYLEAASEMESWIGLDNFHLAVPYPSHEFLISPRIAPMKNCAISLVKRAVFTGIFSCDHRNHGHFHNNNHHPGFCSKSGKVFVTMMLGMWGYKSTGESDETRYGHC